MNINDLYTLRRKYIDLRENVLNIIEVTKNTVNDLERPNEDTKKYYTKNEMPVDGNILKQIRKELIEKNNHLVNIVVRNINSKINSIESEIAVLEEIERKRREAAQTTKNYSSHISSSSTASQSTPPTSQSTAPVSQPKPRVQKNIRVSTN